MHQVGRVALLFLALIVTGSSIAKAGSPSTRPSIAVLPFETIGESGHAWVGQAIAESMGGALHTPALHVKATSDPATAMAAAKDAGAYIVIFGSVQFVGDEMRLLAHVARVSDGRTVAELKRDGNLSDLFTIEDDVTAQAAHLLVPAKAMSGPRPAIAMAGPVVGTAPPSYFDGDLSASLQIPDLYRAQYDTYYYHPNQFGYCGYGLPFGCGFDFGFGFGGIGCFGGAAPGAGPPPAVGGW